MKLDTIAATAIGVGSVASTVATLGLGLPTGALGALFWSGMNPLSSGIAFFGFVSALVMCGVGILLIRMHRVKRRLHNKRESKIIQQIDKSKKKEDDFLNKMLNEAMGSTTDVKYNANIPVSYYYQF